MDTREKGDTGDTGLTGSTILRHEIKPKMDEISKRVFWADCADWDSDV